MSGKKFWLSILAISVVLLAGSLAINPIAIADDDDDDDDEGTKQCVEDCIDKFLDAMEECDELEVGPDYDECVNFAEEDLFLCIFDVPESEDNCGLSPTAATCDQNTDGTIDATELAAYIGPIPPGAPPGAIEFLIGLAEAFAPSSNGNGIIDTFQELLALNSLIETALPLPPPTGFGLVVEPCVVDALVPICNPNSDGTITREELADFFTAIGLETTPEEAEVGIRSFESTVLTNMGDTNENGEIDTADELSELNTFVESAGLSCILGGP